MQALPSRSFGRHLRCGPVIGLGPGLGPGAWHLVGAYSVPAAVPPACAQEAGKAAARHPLPVLLKITSCRSSVAKTSEPQA